MNFWNIFIVCMGTCDELKHLVTDGQESSLKKEINDSGNCKMTQLWHCDYYKILFARGYKYRVVSPAHFSY